MRALRNLPDRYVTGSTQRCANLPPPAPGDRWYYDPHPHRPLSLVEGWGPGREIVQALIRKYGPAGAWERIWFDRRKGTWGLTFSSQFWTIGERPPRPPKPKTRRPVIRSGRIIEARRPAQGAGVVLDVRTLPAGRADLYATLDGL